LHLLQHGTVAVVEEILSCENSKLNVEIFLPFVPSLSWKTLGFHEKLQKLLRFLLTACDAAAVGETVLAARGAMRRLLLVCEKRT
jgi:hypothetical protein